jgi:hypothetical protein
MPPTRVWPMREGSGSASSVPSARKPVSMQSRVVGEPLGHALEPGDDLGELLDRPAAAELFGVVGDRFEAQHVFAFGVALQGQEPEVDLEQGQVPPRCLDHDCQPRRQVGCAAQARALLGAKQRP